MPQQPAARASRLTRRMTWPMVCVLPLCGIAAGASAQTDAIPAGLRACAAEPDSLKRLVCYDTEMARLSKPAASMAAPPAAAPAAPTAPAAAQAAATAPGSDAATSADTPRATPASTPTAAAASGTPAPPHRSSIWNVFGGGAASRVTARVVSLDRSPNSMVLHLDNGQVWQQIERASGDLTLREGDSVTIEKHLGSYYLSSRYVSDMKVRLAPQQSP